MTGFGLGEAEADGLAVRAEIRSVNHRFLQVRYRLPPEFADLEPQVDLLIKKSLSRGSVTVSLQVTRRAEPTAVTVDEEVAARYLKLLKKAGKNLGVENDLTLSDLTALPGVVGTRFDERGRRKQSKAILAAAKAALENLLSMRELEGENLHKDLEKHARLSTRLRAQIAKQMPVVVENHLENMRKRAQDLIGEETRIEPGDLVRELAVLAERTDVSEEISRLGSHLEQLDSVLQKGGEVGRKLDFLVQELYREANTIGSKCNDAKIAHAVVELKTHIERIREQVQNIE